MANPEHKLQSQCVIKFKQRHPENADNLIGYFAETSSKIQGGIMNSLGLVAGVSDLLYFRDKHWFVGIEMKAEGTSHKRTHLIRQANWLMNIPSIGYFCDSEEMFFSIVEGGVGIDPAVVLENCEKLSTVNVKWDDVKIKKH